METKEDFEKAMEVHKQLMEEDKKFSEQLKIKENEFLNSHQVTKDGFGNLYSVAQKNFRLEFGTMCEQSHDQIIEALKAGESKKRVVDDYMACVEMNRQKTLIRASQND